MRKTHQRVVIVASGRLHKNLLRDITHLDTLIGVDRGALWLIRRGKIPSIALGDFDSVSASELREIKARVRQVKEYPSQKDKTDLELAIDESIKFQPKQVIIYGAIGSRFDHTVAAIGLLLNLQSHNIYGQIVDNFNKVYIVRRQYQQIIKTFPFKYVSIIPLSDQITVTLTGFTYNVSDFTLARMSTRGISNEIIGKKATVEVHEGVALVIESRD